MAQDKITNAILWLPKKILCIILYPFKKLFYLILRFVGRQVKKLTSWVIKAFRKSLTWTAGDSTDDGLVNFLVSFRPIIILLVSGYIMQFLLTSSDLLGNLVFLLTQAVIIFFNMVLFYSKPTKSTFIPQLYYNLRTLFVGILLGYTGFLMIKLGNPDPETIPPKTVDIIVNYIAILLVGIFPFLLRKYCDFVWDKFSEFLSKEQLETLKGLAISSPSDLIKAQKNLKEADLLEVAIDDALEKRKKILQEEKKDPSNKRKASNIGFGEKVLILGEILIRRVFRNFRRRKPQKKPKNN